MNITTHNSILSLIGDTPILNISPHTNSKKVRICAKLEGQNIGGSIKDRIALNMIEQAEKRGELTKDKIILESTSGNTGIAIGMIAAVMGYNVTITMSAGVSIERKKIMKAYGVTLIETNPEDGTSGAIKKAEELYSKNPELYWRSNQHSNPDNYLAHTQTANEIIESNPNLTHFVAGIGTFGTLRGVSSRLREYNSSIQVIGGEPTLGEPVAGLRNMAEPNPPQIFDIKYLDQKININSQDAIREMKSLAKINGLFVGMSSGANLWVAKQVAQSITSGEIIVIFPDRGGKYLDLF